MTCMHLCPERHVWVGYRDGSLRIWSHTSQHPLCKPIDCFQSEVRWVARTSAREQGFACCSCLVSCLVLAAVLRPGQC